MSQTVVALPRLIVLHSIINKRALRYVKEEGKLKGCVQFSSDNVGSADAKFEVHSSETGNGLVHIRSCYNNKYLQLLEHNTDYIFASENYIFAKAEKPEEDKSKRSCTLFRPTSVDGNSKKIRLVNVHLQNYLRLLTDSGPSYYACIVAHQSNPVANNYDVFDIIDWESLVLLPKYVCFKGDNGKFLRAKWEGNHCYLQFSQTTVEEALMLVGNEVMQTADGKICLRNMHMEEYWRLSPNWIWVDSKLDIRNKDTLFEAVKYGATMQSLLKTLQNDLYCTRTTTEGKESCLNASSSSIYSWAKLEVSELIISRKIENIKYRLMDSRIYGESITMVSGSSHIMLAFLRQKRRKI